MTSPTEADRKAAEGMCSYLRAVLGDEGLAACGLPVWTTCAKGHGWWQGGALSTLDCYRCAREDAARVRQEERAAVVAYLRMGRFDCDDADAIERGDHLPARKEEERG